MKKNPKPWASFIYGTLSQSQADNLLDMMEEERQALEAAVDCVVETHNWTTSQRTNDIVRVWTCGWQREEYRAGLYIR